MGNYLHPEKNEVVYPTLRDFADSLTGFKSYSERVQRVGSGRCNIIEDFSIAALAIVHPSIVMGAVVGVAGLSKLLN